MSLYISAPSAASKRLIVWCAALRLVLNLLGCEARALPSAWQAAPREVLSHYLERACAWS